MWLLENDRSRPARCGLGITGAETLRVGGHDDTGMEDLDQAVVADDLDGFAGEGGPDPIGEAGQADLAALIDPAAHACRPYRRHRRDNRLVADLDAVASGGQTEPFAGCRHADRLVRALGVVLVDHASSDAWTSAIVAQR